VMVTADYMRGEHPSLPGRQPAAILCRRHPHTGVTLPVHRNGYSFCMRRPKQPKPRRAGAKSEGTPRLVIPPDTDATFEIVRRRKRPMSRALLHARAHEAVTDLIWATCRWGRRDWSLDDYRFLVFSTDPSGDVHLYVQFWSEPQEAVIWEVSSGRWNPPADKVMAGAPTEYVERLGFAIGGQAENFQREIRIRRHRDAAQAARVVLDIFHDAFGYRGLTPIAGQLVSDSRGDLQRVHDSFTPEDLCKTAARLGWTPRLHEDVDREDDGPVVIDLHRGQARAQIVLSARVPGERLYQSALVDVGDPLPPDEAATRVALQGTPELLEHAPMRVGRALHFAGGVTADWLLTQVAAALRMAETMRSAASRRVH
jgi:hypothetical protein